MRKEEIERVCTDRAEMWSTITSRNSSSSSRCNSTAMRMGSWVFAFFVHIGRILIERKENSVLFSRLQYFSRRSLMVVCCARISCSWYILEWHALTRSLARSFTHQDKNCICTFVSIFVGAVAAAGWLVHHNEHYASASCKFNGCRSLLEMRVNRFETNETIDW